MKRIKAAELFDILKKYHIKLMFISDVTGVPYNTLYSWAVKRRYGDIKTEHLIMVASRLREAANLVENLYLEHKNNEEENNIKDDIENNFC